MKRANVLRLMCVLGLLVTPVLAQGAGAAAAPTAAKATAPAKSAAKPATKSSKSGRSRRARPRRRHRRRRPLRASRQRTAGPRRLEDIHIEGEVPVPQVLFITARDQRRFLESHHERYLRTSRERRRVHAAARARGADAGTRRARRHSACHQGRPMIIRDSGTPKRRAMDASASAFPLQMLISTRARRLANGMRVSRSAMVASALFVVVFILVILIAPRPSEYELVRVELPKPREVVLEELKVAPPPLADVARQMETVAIHEDAAMPVEEPPPAMAPIVPRPERKLDPDAGKVGRERAREATAVLTMRPRSSTRRSAI